MHELSIAQNLVEVLQEASQREKFAKVNRITMKLGEMAGVDREALSFCFEVASRNSCAEGAALRFEIIPLMARCRGCNAIFKVEDLIFRCRSCEGVDLELMSGREIKIAHIDVQDDGKEEA